MVVVVVNGVERSVSFSGGCVRDLLELLGLNSESFLVRVGDELVGEDRVLRGDEVVEFFKVVSGG